MRLPRLTLVALACALAASPVQKKKDKEEETQTLQLPKELPNAVEGDVRRLTFHITPLSSKGLLTQQVREALRALARESSGPVLKIRAFVAGSGDVRRVRDLVSEYYTDHKEPLPALSLVQAGGLPQEGAQVILEGTAESRKEVNPHGLALLAAQAATSDNPLDPVPPLAEKALGNLRQAVAAASAKPADALRVTCFLSSLDNLAATRKLVAADYPKAATAYIQTQRAPFRALAACEAVVRLAADPGEPLRLVNPEGLPQVPGESQIALVGPTRVVLSGTQVSFGYQEQDARLAFQRMEKALEQDGTSLRQVAFAQYYPLSLGIADQVRKVRAEFFDAQHAPAGAFLLFEGLPSLDAGFAVEVVAVKQ